MKTVQEAEVEWRTAFNTMTLAIKKNAVGLQKTFEDESEAWAEYRAALMRVITKAETEARERRLFEGARR